MLHHVDLKDDTEENGQTKIAFLCTARWTRPTELQNSRYLYFAGRTAILIRMSCYKQRRQRLRHTLLVIKLTLSICMATYSSYLEGNRKKNHSITIMTAANNNQTLKINVVSYRAYYDNTLPLWCLSACWATQIESAINSISLEASQCNHNPLNHTLNEPHSTCRPARVSYSTVWPCVSGLPPPLGFVPAEGKVISVC